MQFGFGRFQLGSVGRVFDVYVAGVLTAKRAFGAACALSWVWRGVRGGDAGIWIGSGGWAFVPFCLSYYERIDSELYVIVERQ